MNKLKIEYMPKERLKAYCNNAKIHTAEQVEQIKNSIREFGFNDPIAVWHDNEVVEGHGRLLAVMEMPEIETVPIIRLDDLTDEQRRAYMLVHNKLTMNTNFDIDILNLELDDIVDIDMEQFGFELEDEENTEIVLESKELSEYQHIHYLVTINAEDEPKYAEIIDKLKEMGAEIKETKNNT